MNIHDFGVAKKGMLVSKPGFGQYVIVYAEILDNDTSNWFIVAESIVSDGKNLDNQSSLDKIYPNKDAVLYRQTVFLRLSNIDIESWCFECP